MKSWIFIGILITLMSGAAYFYYSTTQKRIAALIENNATLIANEKQYLNSLNEQTQTISWLEEALEKQRIQFKKIENEFSIIREQNQNFKDRLKALELSKTAAENPSAVEIILNEASFNTNRCLELITGAPLNEDERNAKNAQEFNSECPWLFNELINP